MDKTSKYNDNLSEKKKLFTYDYSICTNLQSLHVSVLPLCVIYWNRL